MDDSYPYKLRITIGTVVYEGYAFAFESDSNRPVLTLSHFKKFENGQLTIDNTYNKKEIIILDSNKADEIVIIYDENSDILNMIIDDKYVK